MGVVELVVCEIVGKSVMNFVFYEGCEQIVMEVVKLMQDILDCYKSGILVFKVMMQNVQLFEQVQVVFDDVVKVG